MSGRALHLSVLLAALVAVPACSSPSGGGGGTASTAVEAAVNVLTFQGGTITELRARRGRGPFATYDVAPERMLPVVERAIRRARGLGGRPVSAVFTCERTGEVIAKERAADDADDGYAAPFRSAVVVTVHAVPGRPGTCRVEIHAMHRGPFHRGAVAWERDLPGWIEEELAAGR